MGTLRITNVQIWESDAGSIFSDAVEIRGNRICKVHRKNIEVSDNATNVIDANGMTLMPGMVEGHCHPGFVGIDTHSDLGRLSPEEHTLRTAVNVKLLQNNENAKANTPQVQ